MNEVVGITAFLAMVKKMPKQRAMNSLRGKMSVLKREKKRREEELRKLRAFRRRLFRKKKRKNMLDF